MSPLTDPYLILGVPETADDDAIAAAWRTGLQRCNPERDPAGFELLRAAYDRIRTRRDRVARALFDATPPTAGDLLERLAPLSTPRRPPRTVIDALLRGED